MERQGEGCREYSQGCDANVRAPDERYRVKESGVKRVLFLFAAFFLSACAQAEDPKAWKEFVKTEGHVNEIPASWVSTPEGKFAHSIKIPNPVPADSGYKKSMSAREYFDHLCKTESGNFIFKTVENVEGLAMLRAVIGLTEQQQNDVWGSEAPGLSGRHMHLYDPYSRAGGFVDPPHYTYLYAELPNEEQDSFLRFAGSSGYRKYERVDKLTSPSSQYGFTWRGIRRPHDRENLISGYEWIVLDLKAKEVLAVLRNFSQTGNVANRKNGIHWQIARQCPVLSKVNGTKLITREETRWVPRVLKPTQYPQVLRNIDKNSGDPN